jgi:hypothetical protein
MSALSALARSAKFVLHVSHGSLGGVSVGPCVGDCAGEAVDEGLHPPTTEPSNVIEQATATSRRRAPIPVLHLDRTVSAGATSAESSRRYRASRQRL